MVHAKNLNTLHNTGYRTLCKVGGPERERGLQTENVSVVENCLFSA